MAILLVEDSDNDILLMRHALVRASVYNPVLVVRDGEEAIDYLRGEGKYSRRSEFPLPDLILLDLNMPRMNGFEFLSWLRAHPAFSSLRVIVLTTSEAIQDINRAYELGANSFLVKPHEIENLTALTSTLARFWLHDSKAPKIERPGPAKNPS